MAQLMSYVLAIIAAVGGIGVVITAVVYFASNFIADRLQKKYDLRLSEELEKYKAGLTNKTYISKTRFDAEFSIYRNLTDAFGELVKWVNVLIPAGYESIPFDPEEKKKWDEENYKNCRHAYVCAQDELARSTPFIKKEFINEYKAVLKKASLQMLSFEERWNHSFPGTYEEKSRLSVEVYRNTHELNESFEKLNDTIRDYLDKLDVFNE